MIPMLEVMIGVFFVFAVSSLTCSAAAELLEGFLKNRAKDLERGIISLVGSRQIGRDLLAHPLIRSLAKQEGQVPTHLPSRTFAIALLDLVARGIDPRPRPKGNRTLGTQVMDLGKRFLRLFIAFPAAPSAPKGDDRYQTVMSALTGSVDDLLEKLPDCGLKRSLTGVLAVAKGQAMAEAAASAVVAGAGAAAVTPGAPGTVVVPGAGMSNQLGGGGEDALSIETAEAVTPVGLQLAPNLVLSAGPGGTGVTFTAAQALGVIQKWFDDGMDQVTAWYKRRSQFIIFVLGCALAAAMNLDAITITKTLATDPAMRTALLAEAEAAAKADQPQQTEASERFKAARAQLSSLGLPIGWSKEDPIRQVPTGAEPWAVKILGLLLTALATSLGAPFWFDLLKRVMLVRAGLNPDEDSRQQRSKQKTGG